MRQHRTPFNTVPLVHALALCAILLQSLVTGLSDDCALFLRPTTKQHSKEHAFHAAAECGDDWAQALSAQDAISLVRSIMELNGRVNGAGHHAFMLVKACVDWMPQKHFSLLHSLTNMCTSRGDLVCTIASALSMCEMPYSTLDDCVAANSFANRMVGFPLPSSVLENALKPLNSSSMPRSVVPLPECVISTIRHIYTKSVQAGVERGGVDCWPFILQSSLKTLIAKFSELPNPSKKGSVLAGCCLQSAMSFTSIARSTKSTILDVEREAAVLPYVQDVLMTSEQLYKVSIRLGSSIAPVALAFHACEIDLPVLCIQSILPIAATLSPQNLHPEGGTSRAVAMLFMARALSRIGLLKQSDKAWNILDETFVACWNKFPAPNNGSWHCPIWHGRNAAPEPHALLCHDFPPQMFAFLGSHMSHLNDCPLAGDGKRDIGHSARNFDVYAENQFSHSTEDKIFQVTFVSSDWDAHATSHLIKRSMLLFKESGLAASIISTQPGDISGWKQELRSRIPFLELPPGDDFRQSLNSARQMQAQIAVNLNGWTSGHRNELFACRIAPIQVVYLGYPASTGAAWADYILSDTIVSSPDLISSEYSEKLALLPPSFYVNDHGVYLQPEADQLAQDLLRAAEHQQSVSAIRDRSSLADLRLAAGLPATEAFLFGCFNQPYKLKYTIVRSWGRILFARPSAHIVLISPGPPAELRIQELLRVSGAQEHQIHWVRKVGILEFARRLGLIDLFLDTWPLGAHTVAMDSMRMGTPLLCLPHSFYATRVSAALSMAADESKVGQAGIFVARNIEDYVQLGIGLSSQRSTRSLRQTKLLQLNQGTTGPLGPLGKGLFNTAAQTRRVAACLKLIWDAFKSNQQLHRHGSEGNVPLHHVICVRRI